MSDEFLEHFKPDFTPAEDDLCKCKGAHSWIEEYNNREVQILRCKKCGNRSVGYIDPSFIFLLEGEK
jgi:hypothetical protein